MCRRDVDEFALTALRPIGASKPRSSKPYERSSDDNQIESDKSPLSRPQITPM
jgi:hypothetical protein